MIENCPPVVIFGFARPDSLKLVFERVRAAKPSCLFLVLDYPREGREDDVEGWKKSKQVFEGVDWSCEVHRNYAMANMGCRDRIESGISWAFEFVDRLMILEDDCVPDPTFFRFTAELLEKYHNDTRVGMICGCDEHFHVKQIDFHGDSYYFDRFSSIWGWATWKRVWQMHDPKMMYWPELKKRWGLMDGVFRNKRATQERMLYTDRLANRTAGTWDGVWATTVYKENLLCIHPIVNLITNYGCGQSSRSDNKRKKSVWWGKPCKNPWDRRPTEPIKFPLQHPITMLPHIESERWRFIDSGAILTLRGRIFVMVKRLIKTFIFR